MEANGKRARAQEADRTWGQLRWIFVYWGDLNPKEAQNAANRLEKKWQDVARVGLVFGWGRREPSAAFAWARKKKLLQGFDLTDFLMEWVDTNPVAAAQAAWKAEAEGATYVTGVTVRWWIKRDPKAALAWLKQLPEGAAKGHALDTCLEEVALTHPELAAQEILEQPISDRMRLIIHAIVSWTRQDPPSAAKWVENLADPHERAMGRTALLQTWITINRKAAYRHARQLTKPDRTTALQLLKKY